ncbi:MAG TPA: Arm DNA-binding domain-containing protein, partial [Ilumatobacteraceae bacterium]|nr:Arm DNA-binding domain-containing protein [Ilumatobacteraceae bacterium]
MATTTSPSKKAQHRQTRTLTRKDESGTWFFVIDGAGPDGRRRQLKRRGFDTKKAAQAALTELQADKQRDMFVAPRRATLGQFLLDEWLPARRVTLRPSTAASYEQLIRSYVLPTIGCVRLQALDGSTLNRLYAELLTNGRTSRRRNVG